MVVEVGVEVEAEAEVERNRGTGVTCAPRLMFSNVITPCRGALS